MTRAAQLRDREVVLNGLVSDFEGYLQVIAERQAAHRADTAAARRLLSATGPDAVSADAPTLVDDIQALMGAPTLLISTVTIDQTLRGEQADLLPLELREALLSWIEDVEVLRRQNDHLERVNSDFYDFLVGRYPTRNLFWDFGRESRFSFDAAGLLRDIRFESVVHNRGDASVLLLDQAAYLTEAGRDVLLLLVRAQEQR